MDIDRRDLMKLAGVGGAGLVAGGKVSAGEPACDGLDEFLEKDYTLAGPRGDVPKRFVMDQKVTQHYDNGEKMEVNYNLVLDRLGVDEGEEMYRSSWVGKNIGRSGDYYPNLAKMTYGYNGDLDAVEKFGVPVENFLNMEGTNKSMDPVDVEEAYTIYEMFLRFHEMNNLFVSKFPAKGEEEDIYLERIGDVLRHPSRKGLPKPLYFGDGLGEDSYVKNGEISLEFLGLGKNQVGQAQGIVQLSFDGGESYLQLNHIGSAGSNPWEISDRSLILREGIIRINPITHQEVESFVDKEVSSIHHHSSERMPGSRYIETKETRLKETRRGGLWG